MRLRSVWLALGWGMIAAVIWLSLTPAPPTIDLAADDKLGHFAGYGVLMFWFAQLYARRLALAAGFIAMGIVLEIVQGTLGYRSYDALDMLANAAGVLAGWVAARLLPPLLPGARAASR